MSLLPAELKSQIFFEISDRKTLSNLSQVAKAFTTVFNGRKEEFHLYAYAKELRRGEVPYEDAADAIIKHIKDPNAALMLFEATWNGLLGGSDKLGPLMEKLYDRLDTQDYDTLASSLYPMYDHVVLETSWAAWAGAIAAIEHMSEGSGIDCIRLEGWILDQFASNQREIIAQGVLEDQEHNAICVLRMLKGYHEGHRYREEKRRREWRHFERKKKHTNNLAEVLRALAHSYVRRSDWVMGYRTVRELMLLEDVFREERICDPSDAIDIFRALEEICINLISGNDGLEASRAIGVFERMSSLYELAEERLERVQSMYIDKWPPIYRDEYPDDPDI